MQPTLQERRQNIVNLSKTLSKEQEKRMLSIILSENAKVTSNRNGSFINLNNLDIKTIEALEQYLQDIKYPVEKKMPALGSQMNVSVFQYKNNYDPMYRHLSDVQKESIKE